jgi:hypothetical protein
LDSADAGYKRLARPKTPEPTSNAPYSYPLLSLISMLGLAALAGIIAPRVVYQLTLR